MTETKKLFNIIKTIKNTTFKNYRKTKIISLITTEFNFNDKYNKMTESKQLRYNVAFKTHNHEEKILQLIVITCK